MRINGETPISELCHSDDELLHYGIKGMKWGVRRYQNKDGSLTPAGKKRIYENGGYYLNPPRDRERKYQSTTNRKAVRDTYYKKYDNIMKKHGIDASDGDGTEAYLKLDQLSEGNARQIDKLWDSFRDEYADATLKDLGLKNTYSAKKFVKNYFENDRSYSDGFQSTISRSLDRERKTIKTYVEAVKTYGHNSPQANSMRKLANEHETYLRDQVNDYLSTLPKNKVNKVVKLDEEHGRRYVDAREFDKSINYDYAIYLD